MGRDPLQNIDQPHARIDAVQKACRHQALAVTTDSAPAASITKESDTLTFSSWAKTMAILSGAPAARLRQCVSYAGSRLAVRNLLPECRPWAAFPW